MTFNKSVLVTGSSGLIGREVCNMLYDNKVEFLALFNNNKISDKYKSIKINLENERIDDLDVDVVIHTAAVMPNSHFNYEFIAKKNKIIDENILEYCKKTNAKLIYLSGTSLYGFNNPGIMSEFDQLDLTENAYFLQKTYSESLFLKELQDVVILRVSAPYHYSMSINTVLKIFIENALANKDIFYFGTGNRMQDFTHTSDIANAVYQSIICNNTNGIYNISSGNPISMKNLAQLIVNLVPNCTSLIVPNGQPDLQENYKALFDITKAAKQLNWYPQVSIKEGILEWVTNYKK